MLIIILVIFLLFGGKKFPELMRGITKGVKDFRDTTNEIKKDIPDNIDDSFFSNI
jgi:sec-independent protein translocase protein TatA